MESRRAVEEGAEGGSEGEGEEDEGDAEGEEEVDEGVAEGVAESKAEAVEEADSGSGNDDAEGFASGLSTGLAASSSAITEGQEVARVIRFGWFLRYRQVSTHSAKVTKSMIGLSTFRSINLNLYPDRSSIDSRSGSPGSPLRMLNRSPGLSFPLKSLSI